MKFSFLRYILLYFSLLVFHVMAKSIVREYVRVLIFTYCIPVKMGTSYGLVSHYDRDYTKA